MDDTLLNNPKGIAERGERIYQKKYKEEYEKSYLGKFVVIDVTTENAYLGDSPESAYQNAKEAVPNGIFHLIKVGSPGAFRVSYNLNASADWLFR